ncbi:DNA recombination protein RmuC [Galenea microaerophila]
MLQESWLVAVLAFVVGSVFGVLWFKNRWAKEKEALIAQYEKQLAEAAMQAQTQQAAFEQQQALLTQKQEQLQAQLMPLQEKLTQLEADYHRQGQALAAAEGKNQQWSEQNAQLQAHFDQQVKTLQTQLTEQKRQAEQHLQEYHDLKLAKTQLETQLEAQRKQLEAQMAQFEAQKKVLKTEFENLANQILEQKGQNFKQLNQESLSQLLNPLQKEMQQFKARMETIHSEESQQRTQLKTELSHLQKLNQEITEQAEALTKALQGQKKVQGNWGELMLENVLESSGLRKGQDYRREVTLSGEQGKQRPDAIVYLPQNKHIIIDAKTSLQAYTRYVNAQSEAEAQQALAEHVQAVSDRIDELSHRDYFKLDGLNSPEVVIMFMPIESAYIEALKVQPDLYQQAIEKQVLVTTPTTLLTSLNMVRQLWKFEEQNRYTAELAKRAEKVYNKLRVFLESMGEVGKHLDKAQDKYQQAYGQLYTGKGNLIKLAHEFTELGVSVQKQLPAEVVEKAQLELASSEDAGEDAVEDKQ